MFGDQLTSTIHVKGDGTASEEAPTADEYQKGYRPYRKVEFAVWFRRVHSARITQQSSLVQCGKACTGQEEFYLELAGVHLLLASN